MKRLACVLALFLFTSTLAVMPRLAHAARVRAASGLQLSIITPDSDSIGDKFSIDVSFRGSTVQSVELYLDNKLAAKRQLNTALNRGILSFTLDAVLMTEGKHDITVKASAPDGKSVIASSTVSIPAADMSLPVRISYPLNGIQVNGNVPVRVHMDSNLLQQKPYVTFFVDKELKLLRNYPPYDYTWDTTRVANGWHVLEAWTQTDDQMEPLKARVIHVNVNNSGGQTRVMTSIPDLNPENSTPLPAGNGMKQTGSAVNPNSAILDPSSSAPDVVKSGVSLIQSGAVRPVTGDNGVTALEPSRLGMGSVSIPDGKSPHVISGINGLKGINIRPHREGVQTGGVEPSTYGMGSKTLPSNRVPKVIASSDGIVLTVVHPAKMNAGMRSAKPGNMEIAMTTLPNSHLRNTAVPHAAYSMVAPEKMGGAITRPQTRMLIASVPRSVMNAMSNSEKGLSRMHKIARSSRSVRVASAMSLNNWQKLIGIYRGQFVVAFDNDRIVFDVSPRVENGMGLAPFRQIFEHTGGTLYWYGGNDQTVKAVNDTREIEMKIGDRKALVNNQPLEMERAPYIIRGRTIVPLTFIRDALNVRIQFEPKSGRLLIESLK